MIETDSKQLRQAEFMRMHTLTEQDYRKMVLEKVERAEAYRKAVAKRQKQVDLAQ